MTRVVDLRAEERRPFALSATLFFCIMFSYYPLRGLRDELGIRQGLENLDELWQWTAVAALLLHPVIAFAVAKFPRRVFIPFAFRAALVCVLGVFFVLRGNAPEVEGEESAIWLRTARIFYVGVSVWVMVATSIFWSLMADIWRSGQGKRLFGAMATGGTIGAFLGSSVLSITALNADPMYVLILSAVVLEGCAQVGRLVVRLADAGSGEHDDGGRKLGGSPLEGVMQVLRSPYLLGLAGFLLLVTLGNAFLYFQTSAVLYDEISDSATRTSIFGGIDAATNLVTLLGQLWFAALIARRFGAGVLLAGMPLICFAGFATLVFLPIVPVVAAFNVLQRSGRYALTRPGRALLFTVLPREERYKAQNFLDVSVYRGGDVGSAWAYARVAAHPLPFLPAGVPATAAVIAPVCLVTALAGLALGRRFEARAEADSA